MSGVLLAGLILTLGCTLWLVVAEGWQSLRHPLDLGTGHIDRVKVRAAGSGWRAAFFMHRFERVLYRVGLLSGLVCLAIAAVAQLTGV